MWCKMRNSEIIRQKGKIKTKGKEIEEDVLKESEE